MGNSTDILKTKDAESANLFLISIPILGLRSDSDSGPSYQGVDNFP